MADVTLKYKGATIGELSESGSKTIETAGKYCEADILLEYEKPQGGGDEIQLPAEYQRVEYIGSRATSAANWPSLSIPIPSFGSPLNIEIKAQIQHQNSNTEDVAVILTGNYFCPFFYSFTQTNAGAWSNDKSSIITEIPNRNETPLTVQMVYFGTSMVAIASRQGFSKTSYVNAPNISTAATTMVLFGSWNDTRKFYGDIYSVKVSSSGGLKVELVPCYRKADGVIGMYDLVTETFYTSTTSGTFIKGADVN